MELEILWTDFAENKLRDIFDYYNAKAGKRIASKIINEIIDSTINLHLNPRVGPIEELLEDRIQEFRYLVVTNYKIIYYVDESLNKIIISNVFDSRQNPQKLKETK